MYAIYARRSGLDGSVRGYDILQSLKFNRCWRERERTRSVRYGIFILGDKPPGLSHQEVFNNVLEESRWADELG